MKVPRIPLNTQIVESVWVWNDISWDSSGIQPGPEYPIPFWYVCTTPACCVPAQGSRRGRQSILFLLHHNRQARRGGDGTGSSFLSTKSVGTFSDLLLWAHGGKRHSSLLWRPSLICEYSLRDVFDGGNPERPLLYVAVQPSEIDQRSETTVCLFYQEQIWVESSVLVSDRLYGALPKSTSSRISLLLSPLSFCTGGFLGSEFQPVSPYRFLDKGVPYVCVPSLYFLLQPTEKVMSASRMSTHLCVLCYHADFLWPWELPRLPWQKGW